jgi:hypothetical protein
MERKGGIIPTGENWELEEKPVLMLLCLPQIPYGLTWVGSWVSSVKRSVTNHPIHGMAKLGQWIMPRKFIIAMLHHFYKPSVLIFIFVFLFLLLTRTLSLELQWQAFHCPSCAVSTYFCDNLEHQDPKSWSTETSERIIW